MPIAAAAAEQRGDFQNAADGHEDLAEADFFGSRTGSDATTGFGPRSAVVRWT